MPKIYRDGVEDPVDETDNPVALAYYRREEGYTVDEDSKASPKAKAKPKTGTSRGGSRGAGTPPKGDEDPSDQGNGEPPS